MRNNMSFDLKRHGEKLTTINPVIEGAAPDFALTDLAGQTIRLSELTKPVLISVFPDINTRVCSLQTKHFNLEASKHHEIDFLSISNNTKDQQKNWCAAEGVDMTVLSDNGDFGRAYGLLMTDGEMSGKLARATFVVKAGQITYHEILTEITDEPNYEAALAATK
ncbi:peroxiredoxin [Lactococcus sp. dk310]|uniref:thiol peroxidase n=2 Tax=Lactococcus TaxID=1357 RepID=UPI00351A71CF